MDISKRIVITFVIVSLIPILFISAISTYTIVNVSNENAADAAVALENEEIANLERIAGDTALFIEERMQNYIDGVYLMENYAEDLFNGRISATPQHSYYWDSTVELAETGMSVPGIEYNDLYYYELENSVVMSPGMISYNVSTYYMPRSYYPTGGNPFPLDDVTQTYLNISSNMDNVFRSLHEMNEDYIWLYMGFDPGVCDTHLFRNYPYDTLQYFRMDDETGAALAPEDDYDPPLEPWYTNAASLVMSDNSIAITSPYGDPSTGLVISLGRPIYFDNGTLIGVVSADVTMDTILTSVLDIQVLDTGYGYILEDDGDVLAHRLLTDDRESLVGLEFSSSTEAAAFSSILTTALVAGSGQETFVKNGEQWYLTYETVENTGFLLAVIVPTSEVVAPAEAILALVEYQTIFLTIVLAGVLVGVAVVVSYVSYRRGRAVVEPIREMTGLVEKMAKQDFTRSITASGAMYEEVGTTVDALLSFQEACRFGNQAFVRGDLNRALANYQNLLEISRRIGIDVGEQTMYLNIGNVFRQRGDTGNAHEYYKKSLAMAKELLKQAKEGGTDETDAMDRIASAYHNMALVLMDKKEYDESMQKLEDALALDQTIGNMRGIARRYDAMGLVMMNQGRHSQARSMFDEAERIAKEHGYKRGLAYINYHAGEFYEVQGEWSNAKSAYQEAVNHAERTEEYWLQVYAMQRLADVLDELGDSSHDIRRDAEKLRRAIQFKKSVIFVIDYSGSMRAQDRIEAAVTGAKEILESQVNPQDSVSIIVFNSTYRQLLPLTEKGDYKNPRDSPIWRALDSLRHPNYATAFYDALGKALQDLDLVESSEHRWVIALTDGQDNSSERFSLDILKGIRTQKQRQKRKRPLTVEGFMRDTHLDVNLIIMGVGEELRSPIEANVRSERTGQRMTFEELLESVCESIPQGQYFSVVDSRDVRLDIEKAFQEIGVLMAQLEVGGTTDDY
ncbi:MAG: tetratricopeptide repeat protein [Candidatus Thorarchaeota archaeon]|nr:tetratricopeptide repeat protein [Candidatus Thorarchaeota archaeon]